MMRTVHDARHILSISTCKFQTEDLETMALPVASTHLHIVKFEVNTAVTLKISI
jgi:hypothetical protein